MTRTVSRKLVFSVDEIRDALIALLDKNSQHAPGDDCTIKITADGAELEWMEVHTDVPLV